MLCIDFVVVHVPVNSTCTRAARELYIAHSLWGLYIVLSVVVDYFCGNFVWSMYKGSDVLSTACAGALNSSPLSF